MESKVEVVVTGAGDHDGEASDEKKLRVNIPVSKTSTMAKGYLRYINEQEEDDEQAREELYTLIDRFMKQTEQSGDANDFHNFSVVLASKDEYALACDILECGLKLHPKNVDMLADYLQYGLNCGRMEETKKNYRVLNKIPRMRWTWRAFAFSINYLRNMIERSDSQKEIDLRIKEIQELLVDFRKYHSDSEETYRVEAETYQSINMKDKEVEALKSALANLNVAPKCALRYADILFERGQYEEANIAIKRCISDATGTQRSVNEGYIYYLYALSILAEHQKKDMKLDEQTVLQIYSYFNVALSELGNTNYSGVIKTKTNTLINMTGIEIPMEYEQLRDCVQ